MKNMQNDFCTKEIFVGYDSKHIPLYKKIRIVTTNKKVMIYDMNGNEIGQAGVKNEKDFNFESLYFIAMKASGKSIQVA